MKSVLLEREQSTTIQLKTMLKPAQEKKLTHYFNILDHNKNGELQEDDFVGIGEDICINLNVSPNSEEYSSIVNRSRGLYFRLLKDIGKKAGESIILNDWLTWFDREIITAKNVELLKTYILMTVKYVFDLYDQNDDGLLTIEEYADMFTIYGIDIKFSAKSFTRLDRNHDEVISKDELLNAVKEFFVSSDPEAGGNWIFGNWEDA